MTLRIKYCLEQITLLYDVHFPQKSIYTNRNCYKLLSIILFFNIAQENVQEEQQKSQTMSAENHANAVCKGNANMKHRCITSVKSGSLFEESKNVKSWS